MMRQRHWEEVYETKASDEVSWYTPRLTTSLELIAEVGAPKTARIIDVGGGASTLVDHLLDEGYSAITVLDVSASGLDVARQRLGDRADMVRWVEADITTVDLGDDCFDIWHDRASIHFLTDEAELRRYVDTLSRAVSAGGSAIIATFAPEGPEKCSGLPVCRYDARQLCELLGAGFDCRSHRSEVHTTPSGNAQSFTYTSILKAG